MMTRAFRHRSLYATRRVFSIIPTALVAACVASIPTHYHTLLAADESTATRASSAPFLIDVQPVDVPTQVDQPQLVVRDGSAGMLLLEHERWIAPLGDELRAALSAELSRQLGTQDIAGLPHAPNVPVIRIKVELRRFDSVLGHYAAIEAAWSIRQLDGKFSVLVCTSRAKAEVGQGYDELVHGHRQALLDIADAISNSTKQIAANAPARCPGT